MKSILQIEDAQLILADYNTKIAESIKSGFDDCLGFVTEINKNGKIVEFNKTVLAGMVHTFIKARIKENFNDIENIETKEFNRIFGLHINQIIFIRFKKINNDFSTSNIKTKQTQKFERQNEIDGLPKKSTFLYAGYIPDPTWTSIKNIYIMCKSGGNIICIKI